MIKQIPTFRYEATCDRCSTKFEDEYQGVVIWHEDSDSLSDSLKNEDWKEIEHGIYCPNCYILDEETDEFIVKPTDLGLIKPTEQ